MKETAKHQKRTACDHTHGAMKVIFIWQMQGSAETRFQSGLESLVHFFFSSTIPLQFGDPVCIKNILLLFFFFFSQQHLNGEKMEDNVATKGR